MHQGHYFLAVCKQGWFGLAVLFLLFLSGQSFAAVCDSEQATQEDLNGCAYADYRKADGEMKVVLKKLMDKVSPKGKKTLLASQRKWEAYRDAQCKFTTLGSEKGTVHPMAYASCLSNITQLQTHVLEDDLNCPEGAINCWGQ